MNYLDILREQLPKDEGTRYRPYRDSIGKLSIGVGRNLDDVGVREDEVALMLENDIKAAERGARALLPNFDALTDRRKAVVINMVFNMGARVFSTFGMTLHAIIEGRYGDAADAMLASKWAEQVGPRAIRLAEQMRTEEA